MKLPAAAVAVVDVVVKKFDLAGGSYDLPREMFAGSLVHYYYYYYHWAQVIRSLHLLPFPIGSEMMAT